MTRDGAILELEAYAIKEVKDGIFSNTLTQLDNQYIEGYIDALKVVKDILTETDKKVLSIIK